MKKSILCKLFLLTSLLCVGLLLLIGTAQYFFFGHYYVESKAKDLEAQMERYAALPFGTDSSYEFYQNHNAFITVLDSNGSIKNTDNYSILVTTDNKQETMQIPLYLMEGAYSMDEVFLFQIGEPVIVDVVKMGTNLIPYQLQSKTGSLALVNMSMAGKLNGINADPAYEKVSVSAFSGTIKEIRIPNKPEELPFPFQEFVFTLQVKEFQARLLLPGQPSLDNVQRYTVSENKIDYQIIVMPLKTAGETNYLFAMTSLQPVNEAAVALSQFYPLFFGFATLLVLLASLIFSKWLIKPLLSLNRVTKKIADMDFSEKLPVHCSDELGQLSGNINYLSTELEEYISKLRQDLDREKQLEETRKRFISGVSHELKTPLAIIKSCMSILRDGIAKEKSDYYFSAVEDEVQRMDALVMEMLDLAKMASGTYSPEMITFDISALIWQICASYQNQIDEKRISLVVSTEAVFVVGHEKLIGRVISNFISNAIRHTETKHSITVSVERKNLTVKISIENEGNYLREEELSRVWEQFYRVDSRKVDGTGLGLAIASEILKLHQTSYGVSNTNNGVCFFFSLPTK